MAKVEYINQLIKKNGYKTYLEIGVSVPDLNYNLIECETKEGCDPYFDAPYDYGFGEYAEQLESYRNSVTYLMTSDEMFSRMPAEKKYDIIFIDGDHTEAGSKKDIVNSLKHLSDGGVLVVHDVIPKGEEYTGDERNIDEWYGNVYKSILDFGKVGGRFACVREGEFNGVALIPKQTFTKSQEVEFLKKSEYDWSYVDTDIDEKMHVINIDDYGKKIMIYHNCEYLLKEERRHFDKNGRLVFGGTESWVTGIADNLAKWGYNVTLFTDVLLSNQAEGVLCAKRDSHKLFEYYDAAIVTTNIEVTNSLNCKNIILCPTCEYFNTNFGPFAPADMVGFLSEWQRGQFERLYKVIPEISFRHFLPCKYDEYDDYREYEKENSMVWSSAPIRGLRFFIERILPKIRKEVPDFKLYICGYDVSYYEKDWETYVNGIEPMINAGKKELAELQKKSKIWVYPNIGRSETSGKFKETYCITAVENAMAGNAIVCFAEKDGISSTLEGYEGLLPDCPVRDEEDNFMYYYEEAATVLANKAIEILFNDDLRMHLAETARDICKDYTWEKETAIISREISKR